VYVRQRTELSTADKDNYCNVEVQNATIIRGNIVDASINGNWTQRFVTTSGTCETNQKKPHENHSIGAVNASQRRHRTVDVYRMYLGATAPTLELQAAELAIATAERDHVADYASSQLIDTRE
jgi:hypothetical protein